MAIGDLVIKMAADVATLQSDLGRAAHIAQRFANQANRVLGGLGVGLSAAAFASFIKGSIDAADRLNDLRKRTGLTGQELLVLEGAAVRSGVGLEAISEVASRLSKRLGAAVLETGEAANAFAAMGINVQKAGGGLKSVGEILRELGAKFRTYEDGANKAALATAALGKGGDKLIPVIEAIDETEERFRRLGITIDERFITAADRFKDRAEDLTSVNQVLGRQIGAALLPYMQQLTEAMIELSKQTSGLKVAADVVVVPIKVLASGVIGLGAAVAAAGEGMFGFIAAFEAMKSGRGIKDALAELEIGANKASATLANAGSVIRKFWEDAASAVETFRDNFDVETQGKRNAPGIPDLAKLKSANDALLRLLEDRVKNELDALKNAAQREDALLEAKHASNLVGEREYWGRKVEIQKTALDAELKALDAQVERQRATLAKQPAATAEYYNAQKALEESLAKRNELELKFKSIVEVSYVAAERAAKDYAATVEDLNIQLLQAQGREVEAAGKRFAASTRGLRERFAVNEDKGALATLDALERATDAQVRFNDERRKQDEIAARLAIAEERIQNTLRSGAISELDAMRQLGRARAEALAQMGEVVEHQEEIAKNAENPAMRLQAEQARAAMESLAKQTDLVAQKVSTIFTDSFADAFADFITGTKTAAQAFKAFADSVIRELARMAAQQVATQIFGQIGSLAFSAYAGGGAGTAGAGDIPSTATYAQHGALTQAGRPYVVGEAGPELFVPGFSGEIVANEKLGAVNYYTTINATDAQSFASLMASPQGRRVIIASVERAHNRAGRSGGF